MLNNKISASKQFDDLPDDTCRLLATWTIAHLDVRGVFYGDPALVKSYVFPRRADVTIEDVARYMEIMAAAKDGDGVPLIVVFEARGDTWQYWPRFAANQVGLRADRETSDFPQPPAEYHDQDETPPPDDEQDDGELLQDAGCLPESGGINDGKLPAEEKLREDKSSKEKDQEGANAPGDSLPPMPTTFQEWQARVKDPPEGTNRTAVLVQMHNHLYPANAPPDYGYMGKVAKVVGGAGRMADLLWQHSTRPPTGDVLAFLQEVAKNKKGNGNANSARGSGRNDRATQKQVNIQGHIPRAATPEEFYGPGNVPADGRIPAT